MQEVVKQLGPSACCTGIYLHFKYVVGFTTLYFVGWCTVSLGIELPIKTQVHDVSYHNNQIGSYVISAFASYDT